MIYLAEITAYNLTTSTIETLRYSTGTGYVDTVNGTYYEPRIEQPCLMRRDIFNSGKIGGTTTSSYGELTLKNIDGGLDIFSGYAFDGRTVTLKVGEPNAAYSTFTTVLIAGVAQAAFEWQRISIRLRDRITDLQKKKVQPLLFAGANDNISIFNEGGTDLKDAQKPMIFGRVTNLTPVLINSFYLLYQISTGVLVEIVNVFDKGVYLARGSNYATSALLRASSPALGAFNTCLAEGMIKLGSTPTGTLTAVAWEYNTIEDNTVAQIVKRIVTSSGGLTTSDLVLADYATLDSQIAANVGLVVSGDMMVSDALDKLCESIGAWWGFDSLNKFRILRLDAPSSTSVADFDESSIMSIERESVSVNSSTDAVYKITLEHDKNWTVQTGDSLGSSVAADHKSYLEKEVRKSVKKDDSIKTAHPNAQEVTISTLLCGLKYAEPEAQRLLSIYDPSRIILTVSVKVDASILSVVDLGSVVKITSSRYGLSSGKYLRVIGIQTDFENNKLDLKLWG
jgi:hypothetical protein